MENAVDALKMVFAMTVFIMAFTVAMLGISQARSTSEIVLHREDETNYYEYIKIEGEDLESRIVGLETIIPTLYKYYKENYTVVFLNQQGRPLEIYKSQTNIELWNHRDESGNVYKDFYKDKYGTTDQKSICSFDVEEETLRHEPWTGGVTGNRR